MRLTLSRALHLSLSRRTLSGPSSSNTGAMPSASKIFGSQLGLERLPVPPLKQTLARYLESVQPLLTPAEFQQTQKAVQDFEEDPLSAKLQERLEARAKATEGKEDSWLAKWWDSYAYLSARDPLVPYVNYFYRHRPCSSESKASRVAAQLLKGALLFRQMVLDQTLEPDKGKQGPMCMNAFRYMFNTTRLPAQPEDITPVYDPSKNTHIVVAHAGRFFEFDTLDTKGRPLTVGQIQTQIESIQAKAKALPPGPGVGVMTTLPRDDWTAGRQSLIHFGPKNKQALARIDSSITVLVLPSAPASMDLDTTSRTLWLGDGFDTWMDKHQWVVFPDGQSGFNGEHAKMDGTATVRVNEFVLAAIKAGKLEPTASDGDGSSSLSEVKEIEFELEDLLTSSVETVRRKWSYMSERQHLKVVDFTGYGKNLMKRHKTSPDAWAQLTKQLAFYYLEGRPACTYESAQTRRFLLGRTEVIRACSSENKAWVEAMQDPSSTDEKRLSLFRAACTRHINYAGWAASGQAIDRHLFGLKQLLERDEPIPALYRDIGFAKSSHWVLSTSNLSTPLFTNWGYGAVVQDGFGLSYSILDDSIVWTVTSSRRDTDEFAQCLKKAALDVQAFMERCLKAGLEATPDVPSSKPKL